MRTPLIVRSLVGMGRIACYGSTLTYREGWQESGRHKAPYENGASLGVLAPVCHPALGTDRELEYQQNAFAGDLFPPRSRYPPKVRSSRAISNAKGARQRPGGGEARVPRARTTRIGHARVKAARHRNGGKVCRPTTKGEVLAIRGSDGRKCFLHTTMSCSCLASDRR